MEEFGSIVNGLPSGKEEAFRVPELGGEEDLRFECGSRGVEQAVERGIEGCLRSG
jgi:hypothetical protein